MSDKNMHDSLFAETDEQGKKSMLKAFGDNIRRLRKSKGLTQEELGEKAGVNYKFISEIERGLKNPSCLVVYKICQTLGISPAEILANDSCPDIDGSPMKKVKRLFKNKDKKDIQKAVKILEVFFE